MKRQYAFITGILMCVFGGLSLLGGILLAGLSALVKYDTTLTTYEATVVRNVLLITGIIVMIFAGVQVLVGGFLCRAKNPKMRDETIQPLLVIALVLGLFGSIVVLIFSIIALCQKDEVATQVAPQVQCASSQVEFDMAHARLKQYLADGIITEEQYKQKVHELTDKYLV
jgi:uncharacterized membrane protein